MRDKLEKIFDKYNSAHCMCGTFEFCEVCLPNSARNNLLTDIDELLHGPKPKPTVADYGKSITISWNELTMSNTTDEALKRIEKNEKVGY